MKIQFLIAASDTGYVEHLSKVLMEKHMDLLEISICSNVERLRETGSKRHYDVVLADPDMAKEAMALKVSLVLLLWDGVTPVGDELRTLKMVDKYQRVSAIVSKVLEHYAAVSSGNAFGRSGGEVTVVWSPVGGSGKTTAALAYAAHKAAVGRKMVYLNLEDFCSTPVYFPQQGKSISTVLGHTDGNTALLLQSIRQQDSGSGIYYFCKPENYDDINELTAEDFAALTESCAEGADEVVVDLSTGWNAKVRKMFELADRVLLVTEGTAAGKTKLEQFRLQNNIYPEICAKSILVVNRAVKAESAQDMETVLLPPVQSGDPVVVYKTLSGSYWK